MTAEGEYHSNFASARQSGADALGLPEGVGAIGSGGQHHAFDRIDWYEALHEGCLSDAEPLIAHGRDGDSAVWLFLVRRGARVSALSNYYSFAWRPVWQGPLRTAALDALAQGLKSGFAISPLPLDRKPSPACGRGKDAEGGEGEGVSGHFTSITHPHPGASRLSLSRKRERGSRAAMLDLGPLPQEDGSAALVAGALKRAGWVVDVAATGANHWLDTQGRSFDEWWAARPGALRSTVQRKGKKGLVVLEIHHDFSDALWDEYEAVYGASWKPAESHPNFIRSWAKREAAQGTLRLGIARIDGVAVAAQFWMVDDGIAYINKLAHVAGHDALSPGTLLTHALFRAAFDVDRVTRIDFGTGDDGYKRDWMEASAPLMTVRAWNPAAPAAWPSLCKMLAKRVAARVRAR